MAPRVAMGMTKEALGCQDTILISKDNPKSLKCRVVDATVGRMFKSPLVRKLAEWTCHFKFDNHIIKKGKETRMYQKTSDVLRKCVGDDDIDS